MGLMTFSQHQAISGNPYYDTLSVSAIVPGNPALVCRRLHLDSECVTLQHLANPLDNLDMLRTSAPERDTESAACIADLHVHFTGT